jgi:hypothetical protein
MRLLQALPLLLLLMQQVRPELLSRPASLPEVFPAQLHDCD